MKDHVIAMLGGSFDPIHIGHLNLACEVLEKIPLVQKILFVPAYQSPFKLHRLPQAAANHRLQMLQIAIEPFKEKAAICDYEIQRKKISYTIDTLKELRKKHSSIYLILGAQIANTLHQWKNYEEILSLAIPIVAVYQPTAPFKPDPSMPLFCKKILKQHVITIRNLEVSSSMLRKEYCEKGLFTPLIPVKVLDYIRQHRLYLKRSKK